MYDKSDNANHSSENDEKSGAMGVTTFGENLENLMTERRYTVSGLAKELKLPAKTVHEWIGKGGRMPRNPEVLKKLSKVFGVSVHYILFAEEDPKNSLNSLLESTEIHTGLYEISIKKVNPRQVK